MKKFFTIFILFTVLTTCFSSCADTRPTEYQSLDLSVIGQEVSDNLGRATNNYVGNCYEFSAELSYISQDLKTFSAYEIDPAKDLGVQIHGNLLDEDDREVIMNANDGDIIKIKGKITEIHLGFMISAELRMDVYELSIEK